MATIKSLFASASAFVKTVRTKVLRSIGEVRKTPTGQAIDQAVEETVDQIAERTQRAWQAVRRSEFGQGVESALDEMAQKAKQVGERVQATAGQSWDDARKVVAGAYRGAREAWEEKREYEAKRERDKRLNEAEAEREQELAKQLREIQRDIGDIKSGLAAKALRQGEIRATTLSADELSANTGLLASKTCPECGGMMTIRQGKFNVNRKQHSFYWQCISNLRGYPCGTLSIRLEEESLNVIRLANPDLDGSPTDRRDVWTQLDVLRQTQRRFETFVGEIDDDLMCPLHVAPLLIQKKHNAGGHLLDSYEHACTATKANGLPCEFVVPIISFAQIASILRRKTNRGIIDGTAEY